MNFWCGHQETTPPDEDGTSVCVKCGIALKGQVLTRELLLDSMERVYRAGYHSMRCVNTPEGWCCAEDCPSRQLRSRT